MTAAKAPTVALLERETLAALRTAIALGAGGAFIEGTEDAELLAWIKGQRVNVRTYHIAADGTATETGWI